MEETDRVRLKGVWAGMLGRCNDPEHRAYPWYGAKGVRVLFADLVSFRAWAEESGYRKGLWLDRRDHTGDYTAENCFWSTPVDQNRRKSSNRMIEAFGEVQCMAAWADDPRCVVSYSVFRQRLAKSWEPERAMATPKINPAELDCCSQGHLFDEANTIIQTGGYRKCRACQNANRRARREVARGMNDLA